MFHHGNFVSQISVKPSSKDTGKTVLGGCPSMYYSSKKHRLDMFSVRHIGIYQKLFMNPAINQTVSPYISCNGILLNSIEVEETLSHQLRHPLQVKSESPSQVSQKLYSFYFPRHLAIRSSIRRTTIF